MSRYWSEHTHSLTPYVPGEQPKINNLVKLNTNENPYGPSPNVIAAIKSATNSSLRKYPDPNGSALKTTIADYYELDANQVFIGNSSDEVLGHTFRALLDRDTPLLFPDITYSFYPVYCQLFDIDYKLIPLANDFSINVDNYANNSNAIIFANPNAPTGIALSATQIEFILQNNPDQVVVIDEAYADFSDHSAKDLISRYNNLLIVQTLSKSRSLAGLRVGLALGHADLIEGLERVKNSFHPYALDALALAGAQAAFEDENYFNRTLYKIITTRDHTAAQLVDLGFEVLPSEANFLFAKHHDKSAIALFNGLRENGIVVRHFDKPRLDNYLRISIGTDEEMSILIKELKVLCE